MCYVGISNECGGCVGINDGRQLRLDGLNLSKLMKFLRSRDDGDHHRCLVKMIIISQAVCGRNSLTILTNEKREREREDTIVLMITDFSYPGFV